MRDREAMPSQRPRSRSRIIDEAHRDVFDLLGQDRAATVAARSENGQHPR